MKLLNDAVINFTMHLADIEYILHYGSLNAKDNDERARSMLIELLDMSVLASPAIWNVYTSLCLESTRHLYLTMPHFGFWQSHLRDHVLNSIQLYLEK
jgi:hypothetical protein